MKRKCGRFRFGFAVVTAVILTQILILILLGVASVILMGNGGANRPITVKLQGGMLGVGIAIGAVLTALVARMILKPVAHLSEATKRVAAGDFSVCLTESSPVREIADLYENFDKMVRDLGGIETLRSDFVDNISHEFKTPLAAIEGYATLLSDERLTEADRREYAAIIIQSTRQLSDLAANILFISKLENQRILIDRRRFSLDEQIRQALLTLEPLWTRKNLALELLLDEVFIDGSEELMAQVWLNLLGNAVKFSPEGGVIGVKLVQAPDCVSIEVSDQGIGMSEEVQRHIFEKFYQADRTRGVEGNGLGLTLVRRILDLSGGEITVTSAPGRGSVFTVILPGS